MPSRWPALLLELTSDAWHRAVDLGQALGVSESTVYRDMQAMQEAGVPVEGVPGKGYRLQPDALIEPVQMTVDEAVMLVLGSAYAAQNFDGRHRAAARTAQRRLEDVLDPEDRDRAFALQGSVHLVPPNAFGNPTEDLLLRRLRRAIVEERTVRLHRRPGDAEAPAPTPDTDDEADALDPYGLVRQDTTWHVVGRHHAGGRVRSVRLADLQQVTVTDATFRRPPAYQTAPGGPDAAPNRTVRVVFAAAVAPSVQIAPAVQVDATERLLDGRLLVTVRVHREVEILPWLLSWGRHVRVLEPAALQDRLAEEARAAARQYDAVGRLLEG